MSNTTKSSPGCVTVNSVISLVSLFCLSVGSVHCDELTKNPSSSQKKIPDSESTELSPVKLMLLSPAVTGGAWIKWKQSLEKLVTKRFTVINGHAPTLDFVRICRVEFVVKNDGQVVDVQSPRKTGNRTFDEFAEHVIKDLQGRAELKFPNGSSETEVNISADFTSIGRAGYISD